jgi:hypothetical protein
MLDDAYLPSLWRVWGMSSRLSLNAVIGAVGLDDFLRANANVHRRLAHSRRRRRPQVSYPLRR